MGSAPERAPPSDDPSPHFAHNPSDKPDPQVAALQLDNSPLEDPRIGDQSDPQQENSGTGENQQVLSIEANQTDEEAEVDGEEEEEGECGFCLFMKSGPCRDPFIKWEECVEEAEKAKEDIVAKCHQVTLMLKECMENNADYYEPVLRAEKEMSDAALEEEAATLQEGNPKNESEVPRDNVEASEEGSLSMQQTPTQNSEEPSQPSQ